VSSEISIPTDERISSLGDYALEKDACAALDLKLAKLGDFFHVEKEVVGWWLQPRAMVDSGGERPRLDRILYPKRPLLEAGWGHGPIGVEVKRSNVKCGSALAQAADYTRAAFPLAGGGCFVPLFVFVVPLGPMGGDLGVAMAMLRVGWGHWNQLLTLGLKDKSAINFFEAGGKIGVVVEQPPDYCFLAGGRTAKPVKY
jgi:hypothetical protein